LPNADENDKGNPRQIHKHSKLIKGSQNKNWTQRKVTQKYYWTD
jgi:hypothetical protein